jgi:Tfp pilus assembly protein PilN
MTATAITAGVIVAACAVAGWLLLTAKLNYADQLAKEVEGLGGAAQEIALSEADLQRYGEVETDINRALRRDSRPLDIVHDITVDMPQDVWVTEFSYDAAKNVVVRGTALNGPSVADSVRALLNTERFADVVLDYYNLGQVADKPVYNFQISCKFPAEVAQ